MKYLKRIVIFTSIIMLISPLALPSHAEEISREMILLPKQEGSQFTGSGTEATQTETISVGEDEAVSTGSTETETASQTESSTGIEEMEATSFTALTAGQESPGSAVGGAFSSFLTESFQTDLITGAATAGVPIITPPGRKNIQPNLAFGYSSNNGNSWCGMGWNIELGSIERSTKRGAPAYDNSVDTFVFGGSELVNIGGNEYRMKIEAQFMRIIYNPTLDSWEVTDKSGTKYIFGQSEAAKIRPQGASGTYKWALERIADVYGNYMTISYFKSDNILYPSTIKYTGNDSPSSSLNPLHEVEFVAEDRTDSPPNYRNGYSTKVSKRLKEIRVKTDVANNQNFVLDWRYVLDYVYSAKTNRSLLKSITLYDREGNSLPPKMFTY